MTQATPACPESDTSSEIRHGTSKAYNKQKCRCEECRAWKRQPAKGTKPVPHGTRSGYIYHRCRCEACTEFNRASKASWSDRNPDYAREYGAKRRQENGESIAATRALRTAERRAIIAEAKARACTDCGVQYPSYVMQFDHRNPAEKSFTIADIRSVSAERLLAEIAKCDVVCANCHMERTHGPARRRPLPHRRDSGQAEDGPPRSATT